MYLYIKIGYSKFSLHDAFKPLLYKCLIHRYSTARNSLEPTQGIHACPRVDPRVENMNLSLCIRHYTRGCLGLAGSHARRSHAWGRAESSHAWRAPWAASVGSLESPAPSRARMGDVPRMGTRGEIQRA